MAQAIASMTGLRGTSQAVLEGSSLQLSGSSRLVISPSCCISRIGSLSSRPNATGLSVRSQQAASNEHESSRRAVLGLVAAGLASGSLVQAVLAEAKPIKIGPPPPPSGGLAGTLNSDEARDLDLPLNERFFLQPLTPTEAAKRAKESAQDILNVKQQIDKKAWPYVQNDLRLRASYLRYDLKTYISAKPKDEKKELKDLTNKLFNNISELDHAAKIKSSSEAEKYYAATVSSLKDVLAKLA